MHGPIHVTIPDPVCFHPRARPDTSRCVTCGKPTRSHELPPEDRSVVCPDCGAVVILTVRPVQCHACWESLGTLVLVRHATPERTTHELYHAMPGPPLSPVGREQARALGALGEKLGLRGCISSPYARALETASFLLPSGVDPLVNQAWCEIDAEDNGEEQLRAAIVEHAKAALASIALPSGETVVVVTHGGVINGVLQILAPDVHRTAWKDVHGNPVPQGGAWVLSMKDGRCVGAKLVVTPLSGSACYRHASCERDEPWREVS